MGWGWKVFVVLIFFFFIKRYCLVKGKLEENFIDLLFLGVCKENFGVKEWVRENGFLWEVVKIGRF